jgi:peptidoglycan/xylan/chitin deacetylase (PgdA/CDA1 family)
MLRKHFIDSLYYTLGILGGHYFASIWTQSSIRILMYHRFGMKGDYRRFDHETFEKQVSYLVQHYQLMSMGECIKYLENESKNNKPIAVITIDDGYNDFYLYAYPILKKYNAPATVYIVTDFVNNHIWLWPDLVEYILANTKLQKLRYETCEFTYRLSLSTFQERCSAWKTVCADCLKIGPGKQRELINDLAHLSGTAVPDAPTQEYRSLTWDEIHDLVQNKVEIGSHTVTHPILTNTSEEQMISEISESKTNIEEKIQKPVASFCYPNGEMEDYNETIKKAVRKSNYKSAVTSIFGLNTRDHDYFELRRIQGGKNDFITNLSGMTSIIIDLKRYLTRR